ncbi:type IV pilus assembly PilZ [Leptothrix cholodnii SP-6]|uniref:Type IV pilus assembly PilZ n=1 Tax=Leptothrix cholodnii (strain ATCC 51168 / LMG 8142 / SP-6) TaxID=395495 RepID=B1Y5E2_LEPCP|nr:PilZ domain-containing protein [Leptothrix cholodnii]ACB33530.1 type IV pilus assembly PilZ [Leptothrix cholodnii SP-6]
MSTGPLAQGSIDNRREPRYTVNWPARLDLGNGQLVEVKVRDISESGLGLRCERPLPEHARLKITVGVPDLHDPTRLQAVPGTVKLVFVVMSGHEWRLGAQWAELGEPARQLLKQWITKLRFG